MTWMPPRSPGVEYVRERLRKLERERADKGNRPWERQESVHQRSSYRIRQPFVLLVLVIIALIILLMFLFLSPGSSP